MMSETPSQGASHGGSPRLALPLDLGPPLVFSELPTATGVRTLYLDSFLKVGHTDCHTSPISRACTPGKHSRGGANVSRGSVSIKYVAW